METKTNFIEDSIKWMDEIQSIIKEYKATNFNNTESNLEITFESENVESK